MEWKKEMILLVCLYGAWPTVGREVGVMGDSAPALGRMVAERAQPGLLPEAVLPSWPAVCSLQGRVLCLPSLGGNPALSCVLCSGLGLSCK